MIEIGKYNTLEILRETSVGLFLGDEDGEDVLLPNKYIPEDYDIGDELKVFVYLDYDERKVATNLEPHIKLHEFALLKVAILNDVGAFMDWGLEKQLLVPFKEQRQRMEEGRWYVVFLDFDELSQRLYATNKIEKRLSNDNINFENGQEVDLLIYKETDIGYSVIVNNVHKGLVYKNEVHDTIRIGDRRKGYIKKIREQNKLDISLTPIGYRNANTMNSKLIYSALQKNDGYLGVTDKSSPAEIGALFGMSKKAFKKAVGELYRERIIKIETNGLRLTPWSKEKKEDN